MTAPTARRPALSAAQVCWLVLLHWPSTGVAIIACLAVLASDAWGFETPFTVKAAITAGAFASACGSIMATVMAHGRIPTVEFDKGTTTSRAIAVVWVSIPVFLLLLPLLALLFTGVTGGLGSEFGSFLDDTLLSVAGVGSLLAIAGPGFSEFRVARQHAWRP